MPMTWLEKGHETIHFLHRFLHKPDFYYKDTRSMYLEDSNVHCEGNLPSIRAGCQDPGLSGFVNAVSSGAIPTKRNEEQSMMAPSSFQTLHCAS